MPTTDQAPTRSRSSEGKIIIVVDTREGEPYVFGPERVTIVRRALPAGDDSLEGHETAIAAERKSRSLGRELQILAGDEVACVVIEATLEDVLSHRYRSGAQPGAVLGATPSLIVDRGVPILFCGNRQIACRFVEGLLRHDLSRTGAHRRAP